SEAADTAKPPASPRISRWSRSSSRSAKASSSSVPPRALEPAGVALVDKPRGPSSFAVVAQVRRVAGGGTGHGGTLDPFATGLLLLLSGRATKLAPCLVGLDKRYLTEVDLTARTSTGDPEGEGVEELDPPGAEELAERLRPRGGGGAGAGAGRGGGGVELAPRGAWAVGGGGDRAQTPPRGGEVVEMPVRRS